MRLPFLLTTAAAVVLAVPQVSPAQQNQESVRIVQQGTAETGQVAEQCLQDLQRINTELVEGGYGVVGPRGYGFGRWGAAPGAGVGTAPAAGVGTTAAAGTGIAVGGPVYGGAITTPRAEMRVLMQAGYILAMNGNEQGCEAILASVEENRARYEAALEGEGDWAAERQAWRERHLAASIPVDELQEPLRVEQIIGSDVRNMQDEDLGDVEDVVMGPQGGVQYALVGQGGFLGIGESYVPVRWSDLRVTPSPYRDTLILDVPENAFEQAPSLDNAEREQLASADWRNRIDQYWGERLEGGIQQQGLTGASGEIQEETGASQ